MRKEFFYGLILLLGMQTATAQTSTKQPVAIKQPAATQAVVNAGTPMGRFELYSGIPTVYLGHIILQADGKYKVAFANADTVYETGTYTFHPDTNTIEWLTGLFKNKNWQGKITPKSGGYRIEFNKNTFAEN